MTPVSKDDVVRKITISCVSWLDSEQLRRLEGVCNLALRDVTLSKEENALSTEVLVPNDKLLEQFLAIKMVKGLSKKSLIYYKQTVERFFRYISKPAEDVTANDVRVYLALRETQDNLTKTSLGNELRNLRSFFGTCSSEEMIPRDPTQKIDAIKEQKKVKEPFTEMEMERIRQACTGRLGLNLKHLAIVETLYSTGCRVSELCGMDTADLDGERIKVLGKGNKERICYLNPRALMALSNYLKSRTDDSPALFPGFNIVTKEITTRMTPSTIEAIIRNLGKRANVENCHPHRFRRTAATFALRRGMPIEQVSKMLGHANISTTQIYAITEESELYESHKKYLT